ncbi:odorant receptor 30a-like [Cylas formicarius]|uniref:odorant receptor 30a-like n=1 Tax=Cylas formicarius TaxID=197179 RepID=UPI00295870A4|nr:odorant receptor 30a-like [Cylas formicarius]
MEVDNYFTHVRRLMMVIGIWKVDSPDISIFRKRIYQAYSVCFQLFCYSAAFSLLAEIPSLVNSDLASAVDNANRFIMYASHIIIKMIAWQSKRMVDLLGILLQQNQYMQEASRKDLHIRRLYLRHARFNYKIMFILFGSGTVITVSLPIAGLMEIYKFMQSPESVNATEKPLPNRYWYPFDRNKHYVVALVDQSIRPTLSCLCASVTSASLNSLAIFVRAQLKLLQYRFQHFHQREEEAFAALKRLCVRHQRLIECTVEFSESLKYIVMIDYTVCSATFALVILQITAGEDVITSLAVLSFITLQLIAFSWNCNEIILQSKEMTNALFESHWYDQDQATKVLVHIMMMRCQRPLSVHIGWMGVMDLEAGMSRLKLGYSYTSIMKN